MQNHASGTSNHEVDGGTQLVEGLSLLSALGRKQTEK
jgi:hypothetical protein